MNFIGLRPGMVKNEEILKELRDKEKIYKIKPGITGLAQEFVEEILTIMKKKLI